MGAVSTANPASPAKPVKNTETNLVNAAKLHILDRTHYGVASMVKGQLKAQVFTLFAQAHDVQRVLENVNTTELP